MSTTQSPANPADDYDSPWKGQLEVARKLMASGFSAEQVASIAEVPVGVAGLKHELETLADAILTAPTLEALFTTDATHS